VVYVPIKYTSNNSGGDWWLSDDDWRNLADAGWRVEWIKDDPYWQENGGVGDRWLGALARSAIRDGLSMAEAIAEFERVTGQDANAEGCHCCGEPHYFYEEM
jgi:hypothetical protein